MTLQCDIKVRLSIFMGSFSSYMSLLSTLCLFTCYMISQNMGGKSGNFFDIS